jgi:hypothetical protein
MNASPTLDEIAEAGASTLISIESALITPSKTAEFALSEAREALAKFKRNARLAILCASQQAQTAREREAREAAATPKNTAPKKGTP